MDGNIILIVTYFKKTYITQPPAAGTLCWDEFLQLTIVLSVCIGFIQTGAFLFTENYLGHGQKFLVTPRGKCAFYLLSRKGAQLPPPSHTLPPRYTYLLGRRYQCLRNALFQPQQCKRQCRNGSHRLSQPVISLNNRTRRRNKMTIKFKNNEHEKFYEQCLGRTGSLDPYHKAFFYMMPLQTIRSGLRMGQKNGA